MDSDQQLLEDLRRNPELHRALRRLRLRAKLTQAQVAALVTGAGVAAGNQEQKLSEVFYRKCESESDPRSPSAATLAAILEALGSNARELYLMLGEIDSESEKIEERYRMTESTQRYVTPSSLPAALKPLAKVVPPELLSDAPSSFSFAAAPAKTALRSASRSAGVSADASSQAFGAASVMNALSPTAPLLAKVDMIRNEISLGLDDLSAHQQDTLLGVFRSLRGRSS